jgi:hypothetical protein
MGFPPRRHWAIAMEKTCVEFSISAVEKFCLAGVAVEKSGLKRSIEPEYVGSTRMCGFE